MFDIGPFHVAMTFTDICIFYASFLLGKLLARIHWIPFFFGSFILTTFLALFLLLAIGFSLQSTCEAFGINPYSCGSGIGSLLGAFNVLILVPVHIIFMYVGRHKSRVKSGDSEPLW